MSKKKISRKEKIKELDFTQLLLGVAMLALLSLSITVGYSWLTYSPPEQEQRIDMQINVGNYTGFNVNTSALFFGTVVPGGTAERQVELTNPGKKPLTAILRVSGILDSWTTISDNNFEIEPEETRNVTVKLVIPPDAEMESYRSTLIITFK
ncbi:MAG: hypothetical protein R6U26_01095 [Candidatus Undinarchaeales archaeon]